MATENLNSGGTVEVNIVRIKEQQRSKEKDRLIDVYKRQV